MWLAFNNLRGRMGRRADMLDLESLLLHGIMGRRENRSDLKVFPSHIGEKIKYYFFIVSFLCLGMFFRKSHFDFFFTTSKLHLTFNLNIYGGHDLLIEDLELIYLDIEKTWNSYN